MTKTTRNAIALIICVTYCGLVANGIVSADSFAPIMMYVVKKFMDSLKEEA